MKNGPSTLLSIAPWMGGLLSASTSADTPRMSDRRMNSCRMGVHVCPTRVRNWIVFVHSSVVMLRGAQTHILSWWDNNEKGAPRLVDEVVHVPDEVLEDEFESPAQRESAPSCAQRPPVIGRPMVTHGLGVSSTSLSRFSVMISGLSGYWRDRSRADTLCL